MTLTPARYLQTPTSIPSTTPPTRRRNVIHLPLGRLTAAARSLINMHTPLSSSPPPLPRYIPSCASSAIQAHTKKKKVNLPQVREVRISRTPVIGCNHGSSRLCSRVFNFRVRKRRRRKKKGTEGRNRCRYFQFNSNRLQSQNHLPSTADGFRLLFCFLIFFPHCANLAPCRCKVPEWRSG